MVLASCQTNPKPVVIKTVPVEKHVPKQDAPRPLNIGHVRFIVITAANFEEYRERLMSGKLVIVGMTQEDYKVLLKNQAEYKRYIEQQKAVITFYENNL